MDRKRLGRGRSSPRSSREMVDEEHADRRASADMLSPAPIRKLLTSAPSSTGAAADPLRMTRA